MIIFEQFFNDNFNEKNKELISNYYFNEKNKEFSSNFNFNENEIINEEQTKSTGKNIIIKKNVKQKIFEIKKINKHLGKKRKNQDINNSKRCHTKVAPDNIRTKIKTNLIKNILDFINLTIEKTNNYKIKDIKLKKLHKTIIRVYKKEDNLKLLNTSIEQIFKEKISTKIKKNTIDYNKDNIKILLEQNDDKLNYIFKKTFKEMLDIYCQDYNDNIEDSFFKDFKRLKDYIEKLKKNKEDPKYIEQYEYIAKNYEKNLENIKSRNKKK